jgi:hypothetical protein
MVVVGSLDDQDLEYSNHIFDLVGSYLLLRTFNLSSRSLYLLKTEYTFVFFHLLPSLVVIPLSLR